MIPLSDHEAAILLGASLMHWGVPFRFTPKRALTAHQQAIMDQASEKLVALRSGAQGALPGKIGLNEAEIAILVDVADNCLEECGDDAVELRLELKADNRQEVETLITRLRDSIQTHEPSRR